MKRSYDYQRVRTHRPYTITSLAKLFEVNPATVRRWIKHDGLKVAIISEERPIVMQGRLVKVWMKTWQSARKQPCAPNEMYCVRCKAPRQIATESFHIVQRNEANLTVKGNCIACNAKLQRFGSVTNRGALEDAFGQKSSRHASGMTRTY